MPPIHTIVTHHRPHLDEIVALYLAQRWGERTEWGAEFSPFPGIRQALRSRQILFWDAGSSTPDRRSAWQWEQDGYLLIGVGGGRFDEHPSALNPRKVNETATSLMARALHIYRRPELRTILKYTTQADLEGEADSFGLERLVKTQWLNHSDDPLRVINWTLDVIGGIVREQREFTGNARIALEAATTIELGHLKLVVAQTDSAKLKSRAFSRVGGQAAVVVQCNQYSQIQIFTNGFYKLDLTPVAIAIRQAELAKRSQPIDDRLDYAAEGTLPLIPEWFFFPKAGCLLNGSETAPGVRSTNLSLDEAVEIVRQHLVIPEAPSAQPVPSS